MTEEQAIELVNISRSLMLNLPEFPLLVEHYGLPEPNSLSPLPDLCSSDAKGKPRAIKKIIESTSGAADEAVQLALTPLATPDRIFDIRLAVFDSAPQLTRLYGSRPVAGQMVALAPHLEFDYELIFPFSYDDLLVWLRMQLQFSSSMTFPIHQTEFTGEELAFLFALADAYKASYVRSFQPRRREPEPIVLSAEDILDAQKDALEIRDRRWLLNAIGELFNEMIHIGGQTQVNLPKMSKSFIKKELDRYAKNEDLLPVKGKKNHYQLGESLEAFIGDFFNWISLITIHDLQIVGGTAAAPEAQEEALLLITTGSTVWLVATDGLTTCDGDLKHIRFGMRSLEMVSALDVVSEFVEPLPEVELPEVFYGPTPETAQQISEKCTACGETIPIGTKFCPECGAAQEDPKKASKEKPVTTMACPACGASVREGVKFCTQCGEPLSGSGF
ncbi:MAG: zinc ribbon domain-containing protein [Anaerolineales bacterium]